MATFGKQITVAQAKQMFESNTLLVKENPKNPETKLVVTEAGKIVAFGSKKLDEQKPMAFVELIDGGRAVWVLHNPNPGKTLFSL